MNFLSRIILSSVGVMLSAYLLEGVYVKGFWSAALFSMLLSILNYTIKPLLIILTIPLSVLTLGLFLLIINTFIIWVAAGLVGGLIIEGFVWALLFSLLLSVINTLLFHITKL
jgi:putative membrane protein